MPRYVELEEGDNLLAIDLCNIIALDTIADTLKNRSQATFVELWPEPGKEMLRGAEGHFRGEYAVPFVRKPPKNSDNATGPTLVQPAPSTGGQMDFGVGSQWLYLKLYAGETQLEKILAQCLRPMLAQLVAESMIDMWFFIRYADPDKHLRLRMRGDADFLNERVLPAVMRMIKGTPLCRTLNQVSLSSYKREAHRYGGATGMDLSEELFWRDSEAVVDLVAAVHAVKDESVRWRLSLLGIDRLLDDFDYSLEDKVRFMQRQRSGYGHEFAITGARESEMSKSYRQNRGIVEGVLFGEMTESIIAQAGEYYERRSKNIAEMSKRLRSVADSTAGGKSLDDLLSSYVHMFMNRLFPSAGRANELVIYDYMNRAYRSRLGRNRKLTSLMRHPPKEAG